MSQIIGCYPSTIKGWIEDAGIKKNASPSYPKQFRKKVVAEYLARTDLSMKKVADKNGVNHHTLFRWLSDAGIVPRASRPRMYDLEGIEADLTAGMTCPEVADKHGCSESWVYRVQSGV